MLDAALNVRKVKGGLASYSWIGHARMRITLRYGLGTM
jgi:hypothetical protein